MLNRGWPTGLPGLNEHFHRVRHPNVVKSLRPVGKLTKIKIYCIIYIESKERIIYYV